MPERTAPAATAERRAAPSSKRSAGDFETAFAALGRKADEARVRLAELPDEAARTASKTLKKASKATRAKLRELQKGWRKMEPKKKAQVIAGVLGALAAVTIPVVVARKRKSRKRAATESAAKSAKG